MIYTFLISIVFIAQIVITVALVKFLLNLDKKLLALNETISDCKPGILEITTLLKKISGQLVELSDNFVQKFKTKQEDIVLKQLSKLLLSLLIIKINSKTINRLRKSKPAVIIGRGLSLLENMV